MNLALPLLQEEFRISRSQPSADAQGKTEGKGLWKARPVSGRSLRVIRRGSVTAASSSRATSGASDHGIPHRVAVSRCCSNPQPPATSLRNCMQIASLLIPAPLCALWFCCCGGRRAAHRDLTRRLSRPPVIQPRYATNPPKLTQNASGSALAAPVRPQGMHVFYHKALNSSWLCQGAASACGRERRLAVLGAPARPTAGCSRDAEPRVRSSFRYPREMKCFYQGLWAGREHKAFPRRSCSSPGSKGFSPWGGNASHAAHCRAAFLWRCS